MSKTDKSHLFTSTASSALLANPFPADALPKVLADLVWEMHRTIKAPMAICAAAVLTVMALAAQGLADVKLPSVGRVPLSLFFLTVAESGERKSAADSIAMAVVEACELELIATGGSNAHPIVVSDITPEGLDRVFVDGARSLGLCNDEGGQVTNSRQASDDGKVSFLTALSKAWDGKPRKRIRKGDGVWWIVGKRLACHLMIQPVIAMDLLHDKTWNDQGMLPRFLIAWPTSTIGTRSLAEWSKAGLRAKTAFADCIRTVLNTPQPVSPHDETALDLPAIPLTPAAQKAWADFAHEIEFQLGKDEPLGHVRAYGCKLAEQAGRIAGCFAVIEKGPNSKVTHSQMERAIRVARFYLQEVVRLKGAADEALRAHPIQQLRDWLAKWPDEEVAFAEMLQKGPSALRRKSDLEPVVDELVATGELEPISGGAVRNGKHRRLAYRISETPHTQAAE